MYDRSEFCPNCQGLHDVCLTIGLTPGFSQSASQVGNIVYHLHCRSCNTYIRSIPAVEDLHEEQGKPLAIEIPGYHPAAAQHELLTL